MDIKKGKKGISVIVLVIAFIIPALYVYSRSENRFSTYNVKSFAAETGVQFEQYGQTIQECITNYKPFYDNYENALYNQLKNKTGKVLNDYSRSFSTKKRVCLTGKIIYKYSDGAVFEGNIKNGLRSGRGTMKYVNGVTYVGKWKNDKFYGSGSIKCGSKYEISGMYDNGKLLHGYLKVHRKKDIFSIEIKGDKPTNKLKAELSNGDSYEGYIINGKFSGNCRIMYHDGDFYEGMVENNIKSGVGYYSWAKGPHYSGMWEKDEMNGEGIYSYTSSDYPYLFGKFVSNKPSGNCSYYRNPERVYETIWSNGYCTLVSEK